MPQGGPGREGVFLPDVMDVEALRLWLSELRINQGDFAREGFGWSEPDLSRRLNRKAPLPASQGRLELVRRVATSLFDQVSRCRDASRTSIDEIQATLTPGSGTEVRAVLLRVFGPQPGTGQDLVDQSLVQGVVSALREEIRRIKEEGVPESVLVLVLQRLGEHDVAPEEYAARLIQAAERFQTLERELKTLRDADPGVSRLQVQAEEALRLGQMAEVERLLEEAAGQDRDALSAQELRVSVRRASLAHTLRLEAMMKEMALEYSRAIELFKEALDLLPEELSDVRSAYLMQMAELMIELGHLGDAEAAFREAEGLCAERTEALAACWNGLGSIERARGEKLKATEQFERAAETLRPHGGPTFVAVLTNLASSFLEREEMGRADAVFVEVRELVDRDASLPARYRGAILNDLGERAREEGRLEEAEDLLQQALAVRESAFPSSHPAVARTLNNLGRVWMFRERAGDLEKAERAFSRAMEIFRKFGTPNRDVAVVLHNLAMLEIAKGGARAEALAREAHAVAEIALANDPGQRAETAFTLGQALIAAGVPEKAQEARALLQAALAQLRESDRFRETVGAIHDMLAVMSMQQGDFPAAEPHARSAWEVFSIRLGPRHPQTLMAMLTYATVQRRLGNESAKDQLVRRARALLHESGMARSPEAAAVQRLLRLLS